MLGTGTTTDPYIIQTVTDLDSVRTKLNSHYKLGNDIFLSAEFKMIEGVFTGSFDGNGFKIVGLYQPLPPTDSGYESGGLFETIQGEVKNLRVENAVIHSKFNAVGILARYIQGGAINNVFVQGEIHVTGYTHYHGGLAGDIDQSSVVQFSLSDVTIHGTGTTSGYYTGGFAGRIRASTINQCQSKGAILGGSRTLGGFVGELNQSTINDSFSITDVTGDSTVCGFAGEIYQSTLRRCYAVGSVMALVEGAYGNVSQGFATYTGTNTLENCYYDYERTGESSDLYAIAKSTAEMKYQYTFENYNFATIWGIVDSINYGYPFLYQITKIPLSRKKISKEITPRKAVLLYDETLNFIGQLENAMDVGFDHTMNEVWTASFTLPADDPKNSECKPFRYIEIWEGDKRIEMYRIAPSKTERSNDGIYITYECEHVLVTLIDDILFRQHRLDGMNTTEVLEYLLDQQTTKRWVLGQVDFTRYFSYKFENESILSALLNIPAPFGQDYLWTFDTSSYPFVLNLVKPDDVFVTDVRYRKNLQGIVRTVDTTELVTRLYPLGAGEGDNQLGIESVNPTALPYIEAETVNVYGIISKVWADKRFTDVNSLFATAQSKLEQLKHPKYTYEVEADELYQITRAETDRFKVGALTMVTDDELGISFTARVVKLAKDDVVERPQEAKIEIANVVRDVTNDISDLQLKQQINDTTNKGSSTTIGSEKNGSISNTDPATLKFFVNSKIVKVSEGTLTYQILGATSVSVVVDGKTVSGVGTTVEELDILPYLSKDVDGQVAKGWHSITITPNTSSTISAIAELNALKI